MKTFIQLITSFLADGHSIQVMASAGCAVMVPKAILTKVAESRNNRKLQKERMLLESDVWAIH